MCLVPHRFPRRGPPVVASAPPGATRRAPLAAAALTTLAPAPLKRCCGRDGPVRTPSSPCLMPSLTSPHAPAPTDPVRDSAASSPFRPAGPKPPLASTVRTSSSPCLYPGKRQPHATSNTSPGASSPSPLLLGSPFANAGAAGAVVPRSSVADSWRASSAA
jgi:hypothetical protein